MTIKESQSRVVSNRVESLDALRGIAALSVVLFHLLPRSESSNSGSPFFIGAYGVELFFMISGFVIFQSLERNRPYEFAKSRFVRLFPTFWFCVILTTLVLLVVGSHDSPACGKLIANLTMIPKQFLGINAYIDGSYWTLEYELYFYVFSGFVFYRLGRNVLVLALLCSVFGYLLVTTLDVIPRLADAPRLASAAFMRLYGIFFIEYAHLFLIGVICSRRNEYSRIFVVFVCSVCLLAGAFGHRHKEISWASDCLILFFCFLLFWFCATMNPGFVRKQTVLLWFGFISYPLYLVHMSIGRVLFDAIPLEGWAQWLWGAVVISLMVLLAAVIATYVEPLLKKCLTQFTVFQKGSKSPI